MSQHPSNPNPHAGPCVVLHASVQEGWSATPPDQAELRPIVGRRFRTPAELATEADRLTESSGGPPTVWYVGPDRRLYRYDGSPRIPGRDAPRWRHIPEVDIDTPLGRAARDHAGGVFGTRIGRRRFPGGPITSDV